MTNECDRRVVRTELRPKEDEVEGDMCIMCMIMVISNINDNLLIEIAVNKFLCMCEQSLSG